MLKLDDATGGAAAMLGLMEKLKLSRELATLRAALAATLGVMERLKKAARLAVVRKLLGAGAAPQPQPQPQPAPTPEPTPAPEPAPSNPRLDVLTRFGLVATNAKGEVIPVNPDASRYLVRLADWDGWNASIEAARADTGGWKVWAGGTTANDVPSSFAEAAKWVADYLKARRRARGEEPEGAAETEAEAARIAAGQARRASASHLYEFDPNRKPSQRRKDNDAAMELLRQIDAGQVDAATLTDEQKAALAKYSGTGGALVGADGKKGSAYEYYTPKPIADGMWQMLAELGFSGGKVLDPCAGTGIFGATAPVNAAIDAVELNATSGRVQQLVQDGPGYKTTVSPFEAVAAATPDEVYDAVVSNVPFGSNADRGGNQLKDPRYQSESLEAYFILRSLEKLRPGGLAAFITPPRVVSGKGAAEEKLRRRASVMAEFAGAYRLPNGVFGTAATDTMTDVVVFRKYGRTAAEKIAELREQNPALLGEANVLWAPFIDGAYFAGEGRRFMLGEPTTVKDRFGKDAEGLNTDMSVAEIGKLLRKFGPSRVQWPLLDAAETSPIVYQEGDTIRQAGQTLRLEDGAWVALGQDEAQDADRAEQLAKLTSAMGAVTAGVDYAGAVAVRDWMVDGGRAMEVPEWLRATLKALEGLPDGEREENWHVATVGRAVDEAMTFHQREDEGFNYAQGYPVLSEAMQRYAASCARVPASLPSTIKGHAAKVRIHYTKAKGFSAVWRGDVVAATGPDTRTPEQKFEAARYAAGGGMWVGIDAAREALGEDFDPFTDPAWCVSPEGLAVCKADDYYVGNLADFLAKADRAIEAAADDKVRSKLLRQKLDAHVRVERLDVSAMSFNLFSPFIGIEEKAEFVRRFVDPRFSVAYDEKTGKPFIQCDIAAPGNENERNLKRFAEYLKAGTVSTRTTAAERAASPEIEKKRVKAIRELVRATNGQFNAWAKANVSIMARIDAEANDPTKLHFRHVDDESELTVPGLNPQWQLHGYQRAYVRRTARDFSGINGFGVGLGKTSTALAAVQYAQAVGTKKKTLFVVPGSVLSNWRKEAGRVYAGTDDCLFVGLSEDGAGGFKVRSSDYDRDLNRILENRHSKIFLTMEAFARLRLRAETASAYDAHLAMVDRSYAESDDKKKDEKAKGRREKLIDALTNDSAKSAAAPYFEDLGVDSLVMDEAHAYKNSRESLTFKAGKFLSKAESSGRGIDAQAKAWFVREGNDRADGVILLTATPITNSPLEVYSMLSLAVGDNRVNAMMAGAKGADDFLEMVCQMDEQEDTTLDGGTKNYRIFMGLTNVPVLRGALDGVAVLKNAQDVGEQIVVPEADELATPVKLAPSAVTQLIDYKMAFRFAMDTISGKKDSKAIHDEAHQEAYQRVARKFGEPMALIGHPFNLINKMTALIADPEVDQRGTFYTVSTAQADLAAKVIAQFNAKGFKEDRDRPGPLTQPAAILKTKVKKGEDGEEEQSVTVKVEARLDGGRIIIDTIDPENQTRFEDMADKAGLDLDVTVPPKLAALIENFQAEEANPRGIVGGQASPRVRQLIFCDTLALHNKIKRLLTKRCGVAAGAIAIITGKINGKPEQIIDIQDGFNAEGEENRYRVVIANEKAEVGINLQKGTQAVHHLTLGWTPDSLTQRNGRGVRQGNETSHVTVYHYDAAGTFDSYKRTLVGKKSEWIDNLMAQDNTDAVEIEGGMSNEKMAALIDSMGDADAMSRIQAESEAAERLARANGNQAKQVINLQTAQQQDKFLKAMGDAKAWAARKVGAYAATWLVVDNLRNRLAAPGTANAATLLRNRNLLAEQEAKLDGLRRLLLESVYRMDGGDVWPLIEQKCMQAIREKKPAEVPARAEELFRYEGKLQLVYDSQLENEWRSEVDMATSMRDAALKEFERMATQHGAYPADVAAKVRDGSARMVDGHVLFPGLFVRSDAGLALVKGADFKGFSAIQIDAGAKLNVVAVSDVMRGKVELLMPGSAGYDTCLTAAARAEDTYGERNGPLEDWQMGVLPSRVVPEIAQRRAVPLKAKYNMDSATLPHPYFPRVVPQEHAQTEGVRVLPLVVEQQRPLVLSTEMPSWQGGTGWRGEFTVDSAVAVGKGSNVMDAIAQLGQFARAHGLKLSPADLARLDATPQALIQRSAVLEFNTAVFDGADTEEEAFERMRAWLRTTGLPDYEVDADPEFTSNAAAFLASCSRLLFKEYQMGMQVLKAKNAEPEQGDAAQPGQEQAEREGEGEGDADPQRKVGLTGDTKTWKDQIKSVAQSLGHRAIWDGKAEPPCWNVPFEVWTRLVSLYPAAAQALEVVDSSGKTSYGKRRRGSR